MADNASAPPGDDRNQGQTARRRRRPAAPPRRDNHDHGALGSPRRRRNRRRDQRRPAGSRSQRMGRHGRDPGTACRVLHAEQPGRGHDPRRGSRHPPEGEPGGPTRGLRTRPENGRLENRPSGLRRDRQQTPSVLDAAGELRDERTEDPAPGPGAGDEGRNLSGQRPADGRGTGAGEAEPIHRPPEGPRARRRVADRPDPPRTVHHGPGANQKTGRHSGSRPDRNDARDGAPGAALHRSPEGRTPGTEPRSRLDVRRNRRHPARPAARNPAACPRPARGDSRQGGRDGRTGRARPRGPAHAADRSGRGERRRPKRSGVSPGSGRDAGRAR